MTGLRRLLRRWDCFLVGAHQTDWETYRPEHGLECKHCKRRLGEPSRRGGEVWQDTTDSDQTGAW